MRCTAALYTLRTARQGHMHACMHCSPSQTHLQCCSALVAVIAHCVMYCNTWGTSAHVCSREDGRGGGAADRCVPVEYLWVLEVCLGSGARARVGWVGKAADIRRGQGARRTLRSAAAWLYRA